MPASKEDYGHHISQKFNNELEDIRTHFLEMGGLVEKQVTDAIHSLLDADSVLAIAVQADDKKKN